MKAAKKSVRHKIRENWDTLLWIILMFATLYLTEFMSNVLFNPVIHRYIYIPVYSTNNNYCLHT